MAAIDPLHQFKIATVVPGPTFHVGQLAVDLSITNVTLSMLIAAGLVTLFFAAVSLNPKVVPGRLQVMGEGVFGLIDDLTASMMGDEGVKYFPFVFTLFSFILMMNMLGLFIFFHTATSQLAVTATLAVLTMATVIIVGFVRNGLGVPWPLLFLLVPIEFVSFMVRPLTLALRLFGNMLGGHIVMNIFASFVVSLGALYMLGGLGWLGVPAAGVTFGVVVALTVLEFVVALLQAFVFAALACVYLNDVVNLHHH
jgi:F-type H+-transporting ATPase subunit a